MLKRYWITFERSPEPSPLNLGCGVTARTDEDALRLIIDHLFSSEKRRAVKSCIEGVDLSKLDKGHVLPNVGDVTVRGIWFPKGYET